MAGVRFSLTPVAAGVSVSQLRNPRQHQGRADVPCAPAERCRVRASHVGRARLDERGRGLGTGRLRGSPVATGGELKPLLLGSAVVGDVCVFPSAKTVNASVLQSDLESLARMTSYTVRVMASTSAGGTNGTRISFKTLSMSECPLPAPRLLGFCPGPAGGGGC